MWSCKFFRTEAGARKYQKDYGGMICKNVPRSRSKADHLIAAAALGVDGQKFPFSVHKNNC